MENRDRQGHQGLRLRYWDAGGILGRRARRQARMGGVFSADHRGDTAGAFAADLDCAPRRQAVGSAIAFTCLHGELSASAFQCNFRPRDIGAKRKAFGLLTKAQQAGSLI